MMFKLIRKVVDNNNSDDDDPMDFLDEFIQENIPLETQSHLRSKPQIHKDAEYRLRQYYDESPLDIVSEEASTRQTVILNNNLSKRYSQFHGMGFESEIDPSPSKSNPIHIC